MNEPTIEPGDLLDSDQIADLMGIAPSTFRAMRSDPARHRRIDGLPEPLRLVGNAPVWRTGDIARWWSAQRPAFTFAAGLGAPPHLEGETGTITGCFRVEGGGWCFDVAADGGDTIHQTVTSMVGQHRRARQRG